MLVVVIFPSMDIVIVLITQLVESCSLPQGRGNDFFLGGGGGAKVLIA